MKKYAFTATIEASPGGGAFVSFPYDSEAEFGTRGAVPVQATFDGVAYTGSLAACGGPQHALGVLKSIREQLGKGVGDTLDVVVWRDDEERTVDVPAEFHELMQQEGLLPFFEQLSFTHRKEYCRWITDAKREETRLNRMERSIAMLRQGIQTPG
jgi:hypothetical protein